jgi:hypothetical protein
MCVTWRVWLDVSFSEGAKRLKNHTQKKTKKKGILSKKMRPVSTKTATALIEVRVPAQTPFLPMPPINRWIPQRGVYMILIDLGVGLFNPFFFFRL